MAQKCKQTTKQRLEQEIIAALGELKGSMDSASINEWTKKCLRMIAPLEETENEKTVLVDQIIGELSNYLENCRGVARNKRAQRLESLQYVAS